MMRNVPFTFVTGLKSCTTPYEPPKGTPSATKRPDRGQPKALKGMRLAGTVMGTL